MLRLFDRRVADVVAFLGEQDVVYVGGGNTAVMLAAWRVHGVDEALRAAWAGGVVLAGMSAGANCWFEACTTDSFLQGTAEPLRDGLGLVEGSFTPHYGGEPARRPRLHELVAAGSLPAGIACDDFAAVHVVGTELREAVVLARGRAGLPGLTRGRGRRGDPARGPGARPGRLSVRVARTAVLPCGAEEAWAVLTAWEGQADWMRDADRVRVLGERREGVGVRLAVRTRLFGVPAFTEPMEVTAWDPPRSLSIRHGGPVRGEGTWSLGARGDGTTSFTWTEDVRLAFPVVGEVAAWCYRPVMRWLMGRAQADLRRRLAS